MKKIILVSLVLNLGLTISVIAQQTPLSNFYNFNEYLLNPAEAGYRNQLQGSASQRLQWQGIEGAPTTTFVGIHGALNEKMGIGGKIFLDKTDILKQFSAAISYAYRINISEDVKLNFGVSAMMLQNSIDYGNAVIGDESDEILNGGDQEGMTFDAETGVMLEYKRAKIGVTTAHLFESGVEYDLPGGTGTFERIRQVSAYGSYLIELSDNWDVEPFVLVRNQGPESFQYEVNALASYNQTFFLGGGYRQDAGVITRVGFQITDQILAAYSYEFSGSGVASRSNGSHEFMIGYKLNRPKSNNSSNSNLKSEKGLNLSKELSTKENTVIEKEEKIEKIETEEVVVVEEIEIEEEEIQKPIEETPVVEKTKTQDNEVLTVKEKEILDTKIPFDFEESSLSNEAKASLDKMVKVLKSHSNKKVIIEGHTCDIGTLEQNNRFSEARANKVKDYFMIKGVNPSQLEVKRMRDTKPLVPNSSPENRAKNRRVEVELVG